MSIRKTELQRLQYRRINSALKLLRCGDLARLEIPPGWKPGEDEYAKVSRMNSPTDPSKWKILTKRQDIEDAICKRNQVALKIAGMTPGAKSKLGRELNGPNRLQVENDVLSGKYVASDEDDQDLMEVIQYIQLLEIPNIEGKINE